MMTRKCLKIFSGIIILATLVPATLGADCGGKAFRCLDTTHFIICVDLGNGVSSTIDSFVIPCPAGTECRDTNSFECELPQNNTKANLMSTEVTTDTFSIEPTPAYEMFPTTTESYEGKNMQEREIYTEPSTVETTVNPTTAETTPSDVIIEVSSPADQTASEVPSETTATAATRAESSATTTAGSPDITTEGSTDTVPAGSTDTTRTTEGLPDTTTYKSFTVIPAMTSETTATGSSATTGESPAVTTADSTTTSNAASTAAGPSQDGINNAVDIITTPGSNAKGNGMSAPLIDDSQTTTEAFAQSRTHGTDTTKDPTTYKNTVAKTAVTSLRHGGSTTVQPIPQTAIDSNFYETTTPQIFIANTRQTTQDNFMQFTEQPQIINFEESMKKGSSETVSVRTVTPYETDVSGHASSEYYEKGYPSTDPYPSGNFGVTPLMSTRMNPTTAGPSSETSEIETTTNTDMPISTVIENPLENLILNSVNDTPNQNVVTTSNQNKPENENPTVTPKANNSPITSTMSVVSLTDYKTTRGAVSTLKAQNTKTKVEENKSNPVFHGNRMPLIHTETTKIDATTDDPHNSEPGTELVETFIESTQTTQSRKILAEATTEKLSPQTQNAENIVSQSNNKISNPYAVKGLAAVANKQKNGNVETTIAKEMVYSEQLIVKNSSKLTNNHHPSGTTDIKKTISVNVDKPANSYRSINSSTHTTTSSAFDSSKNPNDRVVNQSQDKYGIIPLQSYIKPKDQGVIEVKQRNAVKGNESYSTRADPGHSKNITGKIVIVKQIKYPNSPNKPLVKNDKTVHSKTQETNKQTKLKSNSESDHKTKKKTIPNSAIDCKKLGRGRYSDPTDCRKFHICVGARGPIHGTCPQNTVFSDIKRQCTKNLAECVRDDKFQCLKTGRFRRDHSDDVYYICAKNSLGGFVRYKLRCQKGYRLDKKTIKCILTDDKKSSESSESEFRCVREGKFSAPGECTKYYECYTKHKKLLKRTRLCESDEIYHKKKEKCVDAESYECDTK